MPQFLSMRPAGPSFFAHVFHPAFNIDIQDASHTIEKFNNHVRAVGKGVQGLRNTFNRVREARIGRYSHWFEYTSLTNIDAFRDVQSRAPAFLLPPVPYHCEAIVISTSSWRS